MTLNSIGTLLLTIVLACGSARMAYADVSVSGLMGDHMVLQRGVRVPIWGTADSGESITVEFDGQTATAEADGSGSWIAYLEPMDASSSPRTMVITGDNQITLTDVQVGEVWVGSGQSNMQRPLSGDCDAATAVADAANHEMRFFNVTANGGNVSNTVWETSDPASASSFSATHFYFGRDLAQNLADVPIGLISSAVSATAIERWATCAGSGSLYRGQIVPLQPYAIRGATWYQGEWDARGGQDSAKYYWQLPCLIDEWRTDWDTDWEQGAFPFYVVQMPKMGIGNIHVIRDAELQTTLQDPKVEMIVTIDQPGRDVHPPCKEPFGHRLALLARELEYGEVIDARSPLHDEAASSVVGDTIHVVFDHVADGLQSSGGALAEWEIAGANGSYVPAAAVIVSPNTVAVSSPSVPSPVSARYAFRTDPAANNLINSVGLPASPIREVAPSAAGPVCGDGSCDPGEDPCSCQADCGAPPATESICSDGLDEDCDADVDCNDADCLGDPACPYCGDLSCDPTEDRCSCADDCGAPPMSETDCTDGLDEDCDGAADCEDPDCSADPACTPTCDGDSICEAGEDCDSCPGDCDSVTNRRPSNRYCCGNGVLEGPEGDGRCDGHF